MATSNLKLYLHPIDPVSEYRELEMVKMLFAFLAVVEGSFSIKYLFRKIVIFIIFIDNLPFSIVFVF